MDVFIILHFLELYASATNYFRGEQRNSSRSYILTLLTLLSAEAKSALLLRFPKLKYAIFRCYIFPDGPVWFIDNLLCPCDLSKDRSYVNANVSVFSIFNNGQFYLKYYLLRHSPRRRDSAKCQLLSILNFHSPKY